VDNYDVIAALSGSGFSFQTAIASTVRNMGSFQVEEEVAWNDNTGVPRFLDLVASAESVRICIECKVLKKSKLVFLVPKDTSTPSTPLIHSVFLTRMEDPGRRSFVQYGDCSWLPASAQSMYCVVCGQNDKGGRLIERDAQPLIQGTEQYAIDRIRTFQQDHDIVCVPLICTTARIYIASFDPLAISLNDGLYKATEQDLTPVPVIRFTKQFTADGPEASRRRTVIITQADGLTSAMEGLRATGVVRRTATIFDPIQEDRNRRRFNYR